MFATQTAFAEVDLVKVDKSERKMYLLSAGEIAKKKTLHSIGLCMSVIQTQLI